MNNLLPPFLQNNQRDGGSKLFTIHFSLRKFLKYFRCDFLKLLFREL